MKKYSNNYINSLVRLKLETCTMFFNRIDFKTTNTNNAISLIITMYLSLMHDTHYGFLIDDKILETLLSQCLIYETIIFTRIVAANRNLVILDDTLSDMFINSFRQVLKIEPSIMKTQLNNPEINRCNNIKKELYEYDNFFRTQCELFGMYPDDDIFKKK